MRHAAISAVLAMLAGLWVPCTVTAQVCPESGCTVAACDDSSSLAPAALPMFDSGDWGGFAEDFESGAGWPAGWQAADEQTACAFSGGGYPGHGASTLGHQSQASLRMAAHPAYAGTVHSTLRRSFQPAECS